MGLSLVTPPAQEPITIDEACAQCRVVQDVENGLIAGYIMAAREFAEDQTRCALLQQTYDATFDDTWPLTRTDSPTYAVMPYYFWRSRIELQRRPLIQVQWVKYVDNDGTLQTLDPSQYFVVANEPIPYIAPAYNVIWPTPRMQPAAVQVRFDAGFGKGLASIPETIRQAMLMLIAYWYDNRGSAQFGARGRLTGEAGTVSSGILPAEIPPGVVALLSRYALPRVLA